MSHTCSNCLIKCKNILNHFCINADLRQAEKLSHAKDQLKMSKNQPIRENYFKNKISLIQAEIDQRNKEETRGIIV